jgi:large subunit ribosomal protein L17
MRHRCRLSKLGLPADQRKAMIRSLTTSLFLHGEIITTLKRAKALQSEASKVVTLAKRGDLHAVRQVARKVFRVHTGGVVETKRGNMMPETVLRKIFASVGPKFQDRQGGYIRVLRAPRRRGDNAEMALVQLVD